MKRFILLSLLTILSSTFAKSQYIAKVWEYKPAPGQFINSSPWGVPSSVNTLIGGINGSLSLGAFGGYVVFAFDNPVENDPDNPFGVDFTIFGNPQNDWSEPAVVYVMKDENNNGQPDDTWYELAGSDYFFSSSVKDFSVVYINPQQNVAADVPWLDSEGNEGFIYANEFHLQPYYPLTDSFPEISDEQYEVSGSYIAGNINKNNAANIKSYKRGFGYADNQLRGSAPYTTPDNPYTDEKENSGGDAFDISWAVDEYGNYVDLDAIHFVKVQNAMLGDAGWLGEISTEITGAVDVEPDNSITGVDEMLIIKDLPDTINTSSYQLEVFAFSQGRLMENEDVVWTVSPDIATIGEHNMLNITGDGTVTLTATLQSNSDVSRTVTAYLIKSCPGINDLNQSLSLYPNPANNYIVLKNALNKDISFYDISGRCMMTVKNYDNTPINISDFKSGFYIVKTDNVVLKFVKD
jgi:hypothetical protein